MYRKRDGLWGDTEFLYGKIGDKKENAQCDEGIDDHDRNG
jgi:hypothetical protein